MSRRLSPAFVLIALLVCVVVAGPLLSPYAPNAQLDIITLRSQAPSLAHPFGTDAVSRDVLSRVLDGGRVSLALAILSVSLSLVVGILVDDAIVEVENGTMARQWIEMDGMSLMKQVGAM